MYVQVEFSFILELSLFGLAGVLCLGLEIGLVLMLNLFNILIMLGLSVFFRSTL